MIRVPLLSSTAEPSILSLVPLLVTVAVIAGLFWLAIKIARAIRAWLERRRK